MFYQNRRLFILLLASLVFFGAGLACSFPNLLGQNEPVWTPAPAPATDIPAGRVKPPSPTPRSVDVTRPVATAPRIAAAPTESTAVETVPLRATATPAVEAPAAASDPNKVVITDADVATAIASGVTEQDGLEAENVQIRFTGGKVQVTADRLAYGLVRVNNLVMIGRLVAKDGQLQFESESVSPGGLVAAVLPTMVNQAFKQYASQWYVEEVETREGEIELTVR